MCSQSRRPFLQTWNGNPSQGGKYPFFYIASEMIISRELYPCQDTPDIKFPFELGIKVKNPLKGIISGVKINETIEGEYTTFYYKQEIPVPTYLINLMAGDIANRTINEKMDIYSHSTYLEKLDIEKLKELQGLYDAMVE